MIKNIVSFKKYLIILITFFSLIIFFQNFSDSIQAQGLSLAVVHPDNPYFRDTPFNMVANNGNYILAKPLLNQRVLQGESTLFSFALRSESAATINTEVKITKSGFAIELPAAYLKVYSAMDVKVEGNTNKNCSCPAGFIAQTKVGGDKTSLGDLECVEISKYNSSLANSYCNLETYTQIQSKVIRKAPFEIKDPLLLINNGSLSLRANNTELVVVSLQIPKSLEPGQYTLNFKVIDKNISTFVNFTVVPIVYDRALQIESNHWISWDPRDLIHFTANITQVDPWGPAWFSEEHWNLISRAADLLYEMGDRSVILPHFINSPFGINSESLIKAKCITGDLKKRNPTSLLYQTVGSASGHALNEFIETWKLDFDFTRWNRWVEIFKSKGFNKWNGLPFSNGDFAIPNKISCDLYVNSTDMEPYQKDFVIKRSYSVTYNGQIVKESATDEEERKFDFYLNIFLKSYFSQLKVALKNSNISELDFSQHLVDETEVDSLAIENYKKIRTLFKSYFPNSKVRETLNKTQLSEIIKLVDVPILNNNNFKINPQIANELRSIAPDLHFYSTSLSPGEGLSRNLDAPSISMRAFPLFATKYNLKGNIYWAANTYRYPKFPNGKTSLDLVNPLSIEEIESYLISLGRSISWSPYSYSIGANPGGKLKPGQGPGSNWIFYPTLRYGLISSIRAMRYQRGLVDQWLFAKARSLSNNCDSCLKEIQNVRALMLGPMSDASAFPENPEAYDLGRERLIDLILSKTQ